MILTELKTQGMRRAGKDSVFVAITLEKVKVERGEGYSVNEFFSVFRKNRSDKQQQNPEENIVDWMTRHYSKTREGDT